MILCNDGRQQCRVQPGGAVDFRDGERLLAPGDTPGSLGWPGREEARLGGRGELWLSGGRKVGEIDGLGGWMGMMGILDGWVGGGEFVVN